MKDFAHRSVQSIEEAVDILHIYEGKAKLNAGGTDLLSILKDEILPSYPELILDIKTIRDLDYIRESDGVLRIGALARLSDVADSPLVRRKAPALAQAALAVGSPQLRKMGTIGGNLCQDVRCWYYRYPLGLGGPLQCARKGKGPCLAVSGDNRYHAIMGAKKCFAVCPSDTAVALACLGARVIVVGKKGERTIDIVDFYNPMGNALAEDEILKETAVPVQEKPQRQTFLKFTLRQSIDFAVVSAAVKMALENNTCTDARIVLGAVSAGPLVAPETGSILTGQRINEELAAAAAESALRSARPLSKNAYKIDIAKTLIKRAILKNLADDQ